MSLAAARETGMGGGGGYTEEEEGRGEREVGREGSGERGRGGERRDYSKTDSKY